MGMVADLDSLWDYEHSGPTEKKFRELLPAALDSLDISYLAELLTQIARAEAIQKKFSEAQKTLDRVEKTLPRADQRVSVRYALERGRVMILTVKQLEDQPRLRVSFVIAMMLMMYLLTYDTRC